MKTSVSALVAVYIYIYIFLTTKSIFLIIHSCDVVQVLNNTIQTLFANVQCANMAVMTSREIR